MKKEEKGRIMPKDSLLSELTKVTQVCNYHPRLKIIEDSTSPSHEKVKRKNI